MMIGRLAIIVKEHVGYVESNHMFEALKNLASLNEALKDHRKVKSLSRNKYLVSVWSLAIWLPDKDMWFVVQDGESSWSTATRVCTCWDSISDDGLAIHYSTGMVAGVIFIFTFMFFNFPWFVAYKRSDRKQHQRDCNPCSLACVATPLWPCTSQRAWMVETGWGRILLQAWIDYSYNE